MSERIITVERLMISNDVIVPLEELTSAAINRSMEAFQEEMQKRLYEAFSLDPLYYERPLPRSFPRAYSIVKVTGT